MSAWGSLRLRYVVGLSVIALLVTASFVTLQQIVSAQRGFSTLINLAGHQSGHSNRIAFFAGMMATTSDENEFNMARAQVGRTIFKMKSAHQTLREGDPDKGVPKVVNDVLTAIYDDHMVGLEVALERFLERAQAIYLSDMESLQRGSADYLYLTTYGPHVLEPMLDAVVDEYERISDEAIRKIERFEMLVWLLTLVTLLLEVVFIFRPLELRVRSTIESLEESIKELEATRSRLVAAQQLASVGDWELDVKQSTLFWSDQVFEICGVSPETFQPTKEAVAQLIHPDDRALVLSSLRTTRQLGTSHYTEYRIARPDGSQRLVYQQVEPKFSADGSVVSLSGIIQDITDRRELSIRLEKLAENVPGFLFQLRLGVDGRLAFDYVSSGVEELFGLSAEETKADATAVLRRVLSDDRNRALHRFLLSKRKGVTWHDQYRVEHPEKGELWIEGHATPETLADGSIQWFGYVWEITERKRNEERIHQLAMYDTLTGLVNRRLLKERIRHAMTVTRRNNSYGAILLLDMDNFKALNDTRGHDVGDAFLVEVGRRLQHCVRDTDTVARLGGDEFVVLLEWLGFTEEDGQKRALVIAEKIRRALGRAYTFGESDYIHHASASIGVVLFDGDSANEEELLKRADVAMFEAKEMGRNLVCLFSRERQALVNSRMEMVRNLRFAMENEEFAVHYQPQYAQDGSMCGAEALLRWTPYGKAPIPPSDFIPIAEETGLIMPIGSWVLQTVCRDIRTLIQRFGESDFAVAVNISAKQFSDERFVTDVRHIVEEEGVSYRKLKFELTESCLIRDSARAQEVLGMLRDLGIRIELDDFGTGYSSLNSLKNLPIDTLKLDGSLVHGIGRHRTDDAIVAAAIAMARALAVTVVAEGVETEEQHAFLMGQKCDILQGYRYARPMPYEQLESLLDRESSTIMAPSL